jgi:hypothetical protein
MSINRYKPYIIVLPEDRANEEITNGFILAPNINNRAIKVERPAKGWLKVVEKFTTQLVPEMRQFTDSFVVLLMDFDQHEDRLTFVTSQIPEELKDRVFVLGVLSEPENLKRNINKTFEEIGDSLAKDCPDNKNELWRHDLLRHNETELDRIVSSVQPFLFRV